MHSAVNLSTVDEDGVSCCRNLPLPYSIHPLVFPLPSRDNAASARDLANSQLLLLLLRRLECYQRPTEWMDVWRATRLYCSH